MNWGNLTLRQYKYISKILESDKTETIKAREMLRYLYGDRYDGMSDLLVLSLFNKEFGFLLEMPTDNQLSKIKKIDTFKEYKINYNIDSLSVVQFIDICNYAKVEDKIDRIAATLSALFIPNGKEYNDGYSPTDVINDMWEIPAMQAFAIYGHIYNDMLKQLRVVFPTVFGYDDENDDIQEERGYEESALKPYGFLPYMMAVAKETNEKYTDIYKWAIPHFCYVVSYLIAKAKEDEKQRRKWKKTH